MRVAGSVKADVGALAGRKQSSVRPFTLAGGPADPEAVRVTRPGVASTTPAGVPSGRSPTHGRRRTARSHRGGRPADRHVTPPAYGPARSCHAPLSGWT